MLQLLPSIDRLSQEPSEHVRAALAAVVLGLAPVLQHDATLTLLLPLFLRLLKDSSPQVRLNIISKLEAVNAVIGVRLLSQSLLPAIAELSCDRVWRVRLAIIEFVPLLAAQLGPDFFGAELTNLCMRWLTDSVATIRDAAAGNLRKLTEVFGAAWAEAELVSRLRQLEAGADSLASPDASPYLLRKTCLQAALVRRRAPRPRSQLPTRAAPPPLDPPHTHIPPAPLRPAADARHGRLAGCAAECTPAAARALRPRPRAKHPLLRRQGLRGADATPGRGRARYHCQARAAEPRLGQGSRRPALCHARARRARVNTLTRAHCESAPGRFSAAASASCCCLLRPRRVEMEVFQRGASATKKRKSDKIGMQHAEQQERWVRREDSGSTMRRRRSDELREGRRLHALEA